MVRKSEEVQKPVVTSLPLPASDSVLVIDLPDGQKLLVGKMPSGSVIEVATWRGTGRPDSRTSRLMLGMSSGEAEVESQSTEENQSSPSPSFSLGFLKFILGRLAVNLKEVSINFVTKVKGVFLKKPKTKPQQTDTEDENLEEWLARITEKASSMQSPDYVGLKGPNQAKKAPTSSKKRKAAPKKTASKRGK